MTAGLLFTSGCEAPTIPIMRAPRHVLFLVLVLAVLFSGCRGLGRKFNQALPAFLRSDPGAKEMSIFAEVAQTREWTPEELKAQEDLFNKALKAHSKKRYDDAADVLEDYLDLYPTSRFDERARFLLGESYYLDGQYGRAFEAFKDFNDLYLLSDYSPQIAEYQYQIGLSYIEGRQAVFFGIFSNKSRGEEYLNHVVERFPTSKRAADAQWAIARYYMSDREWGKAADAFKFLTDNYEQSEWYAAALYNEAYCLYRLVKGVAYDPQVMKDARKAFERYLREFPDGDWSAEAASFRDEVWALEAGHLLLVAEWYIGRGHPYSSRYYLEQVRVRFPGTKAAERAATLLEDLPGGNVDIPVGPPAETPASRPAPGEGS